MSKAEAIIAGLGGADNIIELEPCITRLRTEVRDQGVERDHRPVHREVDCRDGRNQTEERHHGKRRSKKYERKAGFAPIEH